MTQSVRVYAQAAEATIGHLRTFASEREIDLIVERGDGRVVAMEVKLRPVPSDRGLEKLRTGDLKYAVTSSSANQFLAPYAPVRALSVYVTSIDEAAAALDLRAAPGGGGNVLLATVPEDEVVFARTQTFDGLVVAASSQVAADCLGGPGRVPAEGRFLLDWMEASESAWRR